MTEICAKTYNEQLSQDELFYIYSNLESDDISLIFTSKALLENITKQSAVQPSFIHIDGTFKLIDLGLPLLVVSTENIDHCYRPIAFSVASSESIAQTQTMLSKIKEFLLEKYNLNWRPEYVLTDNSDALIGGVRNTFDHEYVHLGCHFHIGKRAREKTQSNEYKDIQHFIFFGIKTLKNSPDEEFFENTWTIIKRFWKEKQVPKAFIDCFEKEYINKNVHWYYGASFAGKSRTNNSQESGNNVIKKFFSRRAHNLKEFLGKMKDFVTEWSTLEKIKFPSTLNYSEKIKTQGSLLLKENGLITHRNTPNLLYCPRKGIEKTSINMALRNLLQRKEFPATLDELFKGWINFRTLDKRTKSCNCAEFYKSSYCKHLIALKIKNKELADPDIKAKNKRGRKGLISKALSRK